MSLFKRSEWRQHFERWTTDKTHRLVICRVQFLWWHKIFHWYERATPPVETPATQINLSIEDLVKRGLPPLSEEEAILMAAERVRQQALKEEPQ